MRSCKHESGIIFYKEHNNTYLTHVNVITVTLKKMFRLITIKAVNYVKQKVLEGKSVNLTL